MESSLNALDRQIADLQAQKAWLVNWICQYDDRVAEIQQQKIWLQEWIHAIDITLQAAINKYMEIHALGDVLRKKLDADDVLD